MDFLSSVLVIFISFVFLHMTIPHSCTFLVCFGICRHFCSCIHVCHVNCVLEFMSASGYFLCFSSSWCSLFTKVLSMLIIALQCKVFWNYHLVVILHHHLLKSITSVSCLFCGLLIERWHKLENTKKLSHFKPELYQYWYISYRTA